VASQIDQAAAIAHEKLTRDLLAEIADQVPDAWLESIPAI